MTNSCRFLVILIVFNVFAFPISVISLSAKEWERPEVLKISESIFANPHDIALTPDGLYLFVADKDNNAVEILIPGSLLSIGQLEPEAFKSPQDVAFDNHGHVYVADTGNGRIAIWKFNGVTKYREVLAKYIGEWSEGISHPNGISVKSPRLAYVVDSGENALLTIKDGRIANRITEAGGVIFDSPTDVEIGPKGKIYLADTGNNRVVIFNEDLNVHQILDDIKYDFNEPKFLSLDSEGMLLVADTGNDRICMVTAGELIEFNKIQNINLSVYAGALKRPIGIAIDGRYLWISSNSHSRIILFRRKPM